MDAQLSDWLAGPSPQRVSDHPDDELPGVEWLKDGLPDMGDEDLVNSLVDFTEKEFFNDSPQLNDTSDNMPAPVPQFSGSSDPSSSADGPTSSGAVCGGSAGGGLSRMSAVRSFSTNDLQWYEANVGNLPAVAGLSAPHPYGGHMSLLGTKATARPALESVPEGAPSQGGPLPAPVPLPIPAGAGPGGSFGSGAASPSLGTSPGSAQCLSRSAPESSVAAMSLPPPLASQPAGPTATANMTTATTTAAPRSIGVVGSSAEAAPAGSPPAGACVRLRSVASTGTLSTLMTQTLQFQRESYDENQQQQQQQGPASLMQPRQDSSSPMPMPPQQQLQLHVPQGAGATAGHEAAAGTRQPTPDQLAPQPLPQAMQMHSHHTQQHHVPQQHQQQHTQMVMGAAEAPAPAATAAGYNPAAAAAAAAVAAASAAAVGMYQTPMPGQNFVAFAHPYSGAVPSVHGLPTNLTSAASLPAGACLALPLPAPAQLMACPPPRQPPPAAGLAPGEVNASAAAPSGAPGGVMGSVDAGSNAGAIGPRLRKSQSALELGAWRSASMSPEVADGFEAPGMVAVGAGQKMIGRLTPEERLQRILRYRSKRNARNFNREIKYQCRKTLADSRPRVGGRFARNDDPNSVLPHQTKKAMRAAKTSVPQTSHVAVEKQLKSQEQKQQQRGQVVKAEPVEGPAQTAGGLLPLPGQHQHQYSHGAQPAHAPAGPPALVQRSSSGVPALSGLAGAGADAQGQPAPASSSTTTTTSNSSDVAAAVSSGTASNATAVAALPAAAPSYGAGTYQPGPLTLQQPSAFLPTATSAPSGGAMVVNPPQHQAPLGPAHPAMLTATAFPGGGLAYSYSMPAVQYPAQGFMAGGLTVQQIGASGLPPPGMLPPGMDPAHLHQHYAMVNAAAQAAARGVYAHLGLSPNHHTAAAAIAAAAATAMPLHPPAAPELSYPGGYTYVSAAAPAAMPSGAITAAPTATLALPVAAASLPPVPADTTVAGPDMASVASDVPPRLSTPFIDALLNQMDSELPSDCGAAQGPAAEGTAGGGTCMVVDG